MGGQTFTPVRRGTTYMNFAGHSYLNTTLGVYDQAYRIDYILRGMFDVSPNAVTNRALAGATLCSENPANAGWCTILQQVKKPPRGAPYVARGGVFVNCWGINDIGKLIPSSDFGVGTVYTQIRGAFKNALRAVISRERAAHVAEAGSTDQSSQWSFQSGWLDQANLTSNSGAGYRRYPGNTVFNNAVATYTIPADFPGGTVAFGFAGAAGAFGGTLTVGGTAGVTGTISTSNIMPGASGSHGHVCVRYALTAGNAGQTITFTVTATDTTTGTSEIAIDYAQIEATTPNLVVVCNIARLLNAAAYASYSSPASYWSNGSNAGASGDTDVANFNADVASVAAEFDGNVVAADIDSALGKVTANYGPDGIHPSEIGALLCASAIRTAVNNAPVQDTALFQDFRATLGQRRARASQCWYLPEVTSYTATATLLATGNVYAYPWIVTEAAERYDGVAVEVTTAGVGGTARVRCGIYDDEDWLGYPQCVLDDWGSINATATGVKTVLTPTVNRPVDPGLYWVALKVDSIGTGTGGALRAYSGCSSLMPYSVVAAAPAAFSGTMPVAYTIAGQATGSFLTTQLFFSRGATPATAAPVVSLRRI